MLFDLCNRPAVFQSYLNEILCDMLGRWAFIYLDDILIYSRTMSDHVWAAFQRLLQN